MIRFFAAHPTVANLLMILFLGLGLAAASSVQRKTFPEIPPDEVEIRIEYPGAGALHQLDTGDATAIDGVLVDGPHLRARDQPREGGPSLHQACHGRSTSPRLRSSGGIAAPP